MIFGGEQNEDAEPLSRGERVAMWIVLAVLAFTLLAIGGIIAHAQTGGTMDVIQTQIIEMPLDDGVSVIDRATGKTVAWLGPGAVVTGPAVFYDEMGNVVLGVPSGMTYAPVPATP